MPTVNAETSASDLSTTDLLRVCNILRRASAHLASGSAEAQEIVGPSLINLIKQAVKRVLCTQALANSQGPPDLYDAAMKQVSQIDADVFEDVTCLALIHGIKGVKEELIKSWQQ